MVASNTSVDFIDFPYRHVAVSPAQQQLRLAQALANGGALDYYLIGRLDNHADRSGFQSIKEIFRYHAAHQADYLNLRSQARIALLKDHQGPAEEYRGFFRFLSENHYLFDVLITEAAHQVPWDRYQAHRPPRIQRLGDELARRLDAFVAEGAR